MTCLSEYALDRLVAGEPRQGSAEHVVGCDPCAARLAERRGERDRFRAEAPPLPPRPARRSRWWLAGPVVVVAAAAAAVLVAGVRGSETEDGTRLKGGRVQVFVRHDGRVRPAANGEVVAAGDRVQLTVTLAEPRHVAVLGVDGTGRTTLYRETAPLPAGAAVPLEFSIELDDTPGEERLHVFFCDGPARVEGGAAVPAGCTVEKVSLVKR